MMTKNQKILLAVVTGTIVLSYCISNKKQFVGKPKPKTRGQQRKELGDRFISYIKSLFR